jgi:hypothetical protein
MTEIREKPFLQFRMCGAVIYKPWNDRKENTMKTRCMRDLVWIFLLTTALAACGGGGGGAVLPAAVNKTSVKLAKTGQAVSYDANATKADDAALQTGIAWPSPRFTDNADGTVTDNLTGLMWVQDANCIMTKYSSFDTDDTTDGMVTWQHALDFVAGINAGTYPNCGAGHTDWRLPNRKELRSLANYGLTNSAAWLNTPGAGNPGFSNVQADYYWSSTTYVGSASFAWLVNMYDGVVVGDGNSNRHYVWPVRSGQ